MAHVAFYAIEIDEFVVREVADLSEPHPDYAEGLYRLDEADRLVCFEGVTPEELLRLGSWAEAQFEEETLSFTGIPSQNAPRHSVQGIAATCVTGPVPPTANGTPCRWPATFVRSRPKK